MASSFAVVELYTINGVVVIESFSALYSLLPQEQRAVPLTGKGKSVGIVLRILLTTMSVGSCAHIGGGIGR